MAVDVGSAVGYLDLDITGFLNNLKTAQSEADKTSKSITAKVGNNLKKAGQTITSAGSALTKGITVPVAAAGTAIFKFSSSFESAMSKVKAISGATGKDFEKLNEKAKQMGATTKFSATESAQAFTYMAMAGWKTEDMLQGIDGVMSLAAADGLDLATTSDIVTDALTAFGLSAKDSGHFADVLAKASSSANTNVSMLGESFKYVAPVAGSLGYSAEDTAIALGLMANSGIKASQAGTALRAALTRMVKPAKQAATYMNFYGLSLTKSDGSMKSLSEVMIMLRSKMKGLSEAEQAQAAAAIFGQEAMSGMLAIINTSDKDFENLTKSIYESDGAAKQMADTMLDNLSGQITILKSSLEGLALQFGDILLPYFKSFVKWIQNLTQKLQELTPEQKKQIAKWAAFAAALGPALLIVGKLTSGVGSLLITVKKIPGALKAVSGNIKSIAAAVGGISAPLLAVIAAVAILSAAFATLWKTNDKFREKLTGIWNQIKETANKFCDDITKKINSLGFDFKSIIDVIASIWEGFCNLLAPLFTNNFQIVADLFKSILDLVLSVLDVFIGIFTGNWSQVWEGIKGIFLSVWDVVVSLFKNGLNMLKEMADVFLGWFGTSWDELWGSVKTFFSETWEKITTFFSETWEKIKNVVTVGIMFIGSILDAAFKIITLPFRFIWENCKDTIIEVWDAIKEKVTSAVNFVRDKIMTVFQAISDFILPIVESIKTKITNTWNQIKEVTSSAWNSIKAKIIDPITEAWNRATQVVEGINAKISNGFKSAKDAVSNIFDKIENKISNSMDKAKTTVSNAVDKIKKIFDFSWAFPDLKLPHFSIKGKFNLNPPSVPHLDIDWYAKAMDKGMILNSPTIFGYNSKTGQLLGGGEAGSETVVGTKSLISMIKTAVNSSNEDLLAKVLSGFASLNSRLNDIHDHLFDLLVDFAKSANSYAGAVEGLGYIFSENAKSRKKQDEKDKGDFVPKGDGDTYNFYSPKPIDEIEAARLLRKTKRELEEGF